MNSLLESKTRAIMEAEARIVDAWLQKHMEIGHRAEMEVYPHDGRKRVVCSCGAGMRIAAVFKDNTITVTGTYENT